MLFKSKKTITVEQSREDVIPFKIGAYLAELSQIGVFLANNQNRDMAFT